MSIVRRVLPVALVVAVACARPASEPIPDPRGDSLTVDEIDLERAAEARTAWSRGVYLREQGDVSGALQSFADAVRMAPSHAEFRLAYAEMLVDLGRMREATAFVHSAIERFGGSAEEHLLLARLSVAGGHQAAALESCDSALARDPALAPAWALRGQLLLDADRTQEAESSFARADSLAPNDVATLEGLADAARRQGDIDRARDTLELVLQIAPDRIPARRALAEIYRQEGRLEDAKQLALRGLELDPEDPDHVEAAVEIFLRSGDLEGAEALMRPYYEEHALDARLSYVYGRLLLQLDRLAAADSVLLPLAGMHGLHGVETLLGDIAARQDRTSDAVDAYRRAIEEDPEDCVPRTSLALLLVRTTADSASAEDEAAVDSALAAARRTTTEASYRCNLLLGLASMTRKQYAMAAQHFEAARRLDPENRDILFNLAMANAEAGDSDSALAHGRMLLELGPDDAAALNLVGYILAERGEHLAESEALIRKALASEPDNGYYVDSLGWVLYQKGDYTGAVTALERAVQLTEENDALVLEHLGDAYVKAGRLAEARSAYERSQALDSERKSLGAKIAELDAELGRP